MAKQQTFADKAKARTQPNAVNVKVVRTVKTEKGSYKFQESYVKLDDINKIDTIK